MFYLAVFYLTLRDDFVETTIHEDNINTVMSIVECLALSAIEHYVRKVVSQPYELCHARITVVVECG